MTVESAAKLLDLAMSEHALFRSKPYMFCEIGDAGAF